MNQNDRYAELRSEVQRHWSRQTQGSQFTSRPRFTAEYFAEIENHRYATEPEIFSFAQFTRWRGTKVLEVGIGAGTDFVQWLRAGATATGVDLTEEAVEHVRRRLELEGLSAEELRVADSEHLPFADNAFDLVYSWGVIHHSPNTSKALAEIVRVVKPGGTVKVMIYHRHSIEALFFWVKYALLRFRPWKSLQWVLANHMESKGTKAFTVREVRRMLSALPVATMRVWTQLTVHDRMVRHGKLLRAVAAFAAWLMGGDKAGWFLYFEAVKKR